MFGPHNAVDGLRGSVTNTAAWIGLGSWFRLTFIALTLSLRGEHTNTLTITVCELQNALHVLAHVINCFKTAMTYMYYIALCDYSQLQ